MTRDPQSGRDVKLTSRELIEDVSVQLVYDPLEDGATRVRLHRLLDMAKANGWRQAIDSVLGNDPKLVRYISTQERAKFLELLELRAIDDVLEIGPGLGQFTRLIAPRVRSLSALEIVEGQARFVHESCRQEGLTNVRVTCGGDDCLLPYDDASFDVIVLSLVLEWCGGRNLGVAHEQMQARLLAEMARVLRPGGKAYVCTKNRYALRYLLGKRDEHAYDMRFGNALPRWWMQAVLRIEGHVRPAGWLHSYSALAALLRTAGFEQLQSYWAAPEMRYPTHYIPTDAVAVRHARRDPSLRQGETRLTNLVMSLMPAPWVKFFTPGLVMVVRRHL